ncbi:MULTISPECIES: hypothetical protein [unclassified Endozoicomonas]|uniref:hypothetical protein n=1 Tax=unclassified Endozoicomonas TaxID=2644528 RepID=UPI00214945FA|nr:MULTISPECIES: hypothetical protein [unclassified Endozoicomonas]
MSLEARVTVLEEHREQSDKVLAGMEGKISLLLRKQEGMQKEMDGRFSGMQKEMDSRFNGMQKEMDSRFSKQDQVLAGMNQVLAGMNQVLTGFEGTVALVLKEQEWMKEELADHSRRFDKVEELLIQIVNNLASK